MPQRERCVVCDTLGWYDQYIVIETEHGRHAFANVGARKICDDCAKQPPATITVKVTEVRRVERSPENQAYFDALRRGEHPTAPWDDDLYEYI